LTKWWNITQALYNSGSEVAISTLLQLLEGNTQAHTTMPIYLNGTTHKAGIAQITQARDTDLRSCIGRWSVQLLATQEIVPISAHSLKNAMCRCCCGIRISMNVTRSARALVADRRSFHRAVAPGTRFAWHVRYGCPRVICCAS
jgi:hypothetical protein